MDSIKLSQAVKLSIILPCYNVEKYLAQALESTIAQSLQDIEIIPVDDGSPDGCRKIIESYAEKDSRIKPIFKKNGGYGSAVNAGIRAATGEYIAILEPDDYVMEDYYNILYQEAHLDGLDVCGVNGYCEIRNHTHPKLVQGHWVDNQDYVSYEGINEILASGQVGITLKIYKRSFLLGSKILLKEDLVAYHDVPFVAEVLNAASKVRIVVGVGYYYRKDDITSTTKSKNKFFEVINAVDYVLDIARSAQLRPSRKAAYAGYCLKHLSYYFTLTNSRFKLGGLANLLKNKMAEVADVFGAVLVAKNVEKSLNAILGHPLNADTFKLKIIPFDECPTFDIDYYTKEKRFSVVLSKLFFFAYYAYQTGNTKDVNFFRTKLFNVIIQVPGLKAKPVEDFIVRYLEDAIFYFKKNYNESWYITFLQYMSENSHKDYFENILESLNERQSETSEIQYFPDITNKLPSNISNVNESFRKTKIIRQTSISKEQEFLEYLRGKSIAVVGNAQSELGKRRGSLIDDHDVVIRFNNFSLSEEFHNDYGKKVDVWSITPGIENLNYQESYFEYDFVMSPYLGLKLNQDRISVLYNYIVAGGNYFQFDSIIHRREFDIMIPSIGLYTLSYLYSMRDVIGKVNLFGFAPRTAIKENRHYFNNDPVPTKKLQFHDWLSEERFINQFKNIFDQHNKMV